MIKLARYYCCMRCYWHNNRIHVLTFDKILAERQKEILLCERDRPSSLAVEFQ